MSIIDSNARFEDEDAAMSATLNQQWHQRMEAGLVESDRIEAEEREAQRQRDIDEAVAEQWDAEKAIDMLHELGVSKERVIAVLCLIKTEAGRHLATLDKLGCHSSCICMLTKEDFGPFTEDPTVLTFMLEAVREKIERTRNVQGQRKQLLEALLNLENLT